VLDALENQVGAVGREMRIELKASDAELDAVSFSFSGEGPGGEMDGASVRPYGNGSTAVFRWQPAAKDVGSWTVSFEVSDGGQTSTETITIEVRTADVADKAPFFRRPLPKGGTVLDLAKRDCIDLEVLVEDLDTASVTIREIGEKIPGAELNATGGTTAKWIWCPTQQQMRTSDTYRLELEADDGDGNVSPMYFTIHVRSGAKTNCPGTAPVIVHTPANETTIQPPTIQFDIQETGEIKRALFYSWLTDPGPNPDLNGLTGQHLLHIDGATWAVEATNPAAHKMSGQTGQLWYAVVVEDNDDATADCDHVTQSQVYTATYTNNGQQGNMGLCRACTADLQCGGAADNCVRVSSGESSLRCAKACGAAGECPDGYRCSDAPLAGQTGAMAKQCVPNAGTCEPPEPDSCTDDSFEENDTFYAAGEKPALTAPELNATICPGLSPGSFDADWYKVEITSDSDVLFDLSGPANANLNLLVVDADGFLVRKSEGPTSTETVEKCLTAGTYYVQVTSPFGATPGSHAYNLDYIGVSTSCASSGMCTDDSNEQDDDPGMARNVTTFPYTRTAQKVCTGDDDWYKVAVGQNETVHMKIKFTQQSAAEDLDILVYSASGAVLLTPCHEDISPLECDADNGQSADSDEYLTWTNTGPATTFNFVVHGYDGASDDYDVCIGKTAAQCP
jgi:hypothetical protein